MDERQVVLTGGCVYEISWDWCATVINAFFTRKSVADLAAPVITSLPSRKRTVMLRMLVGPGAKFRNN